MYMLPLVQSSPNPKHILIASAVFAQRTLGVLQHVLFHLLLDHNNCRSTYNLRPRRHELVLAIKSDARNFIETQLFKDTKPNSITLAGSKLVADKLRTS